MIEPVSLFKAPSKAVLTVQRTIYLSRVRFQVTKKLETNLLDLTTQVSSPLGCKMDPSPAAWYIGKLKSMRKNTNRIPAQQYLLMSYSGEIFNDFGACTTEIKCSRHTEFTTESITLGKQMIISLKDGELARLACL